VEVDGESTSRDRGNAKQARPLQRPVGPADTREVRPRLVALLLLVLLASCGGPERPAKAPAADEQVGTADVERLLVSTQKRKSPRLRVGAASCPDQVRLANGTNFTCTVQIEGVSAPYAVTLRDVDAAGTGGRFALEPAKPIIDVTRIVSLIRGKLQPTARGARVRCGAPGAPRVRVVEIGGRIACTITLGDAVQKVTAEVKDLKGTVVVKG
jgi:Domain of unknown function (DUF4333)